MWDRNMLDWIAICDTAVKEGSFRAASRKYYTVTENNQKAYLTPRYIKERVPVIIRFVLYYTTFTPYYDWFQKRY
jgi:hypothetical protein